MVKGRDNWDKTEGILEEVTCVLTGFVCPDNSVYVNEECFTFHVGSVDHLWLTG